MRLSFIKTIQRTTLFRVTSLNSLSVVLKIGIGLITSKVIAVFIGPSGLALVGNLRNFISTIESFATLGFQNGIVKYIADAKNDSEKQKKIISTVFLTLLSIVLVLSILLFSFANYWNAIIFNNSYQYQSVFRFLALALPWYAASIILIAIINGLGKFKNVITINIIGNCIGFLFSVIVIWRYRTYGALLSIIIPPSLLFFVSFYFINKEIPFFQSINLSWFDSKIIKDLSSYSLMAVVSSVLGPIVLLAIRSNIIATLGMEQAGFWEAISRISSYYLLFISTILTVYFLPKLAFATNKKATKNVLLSYYKGIMPIFIIGLIILYFLRFFIIKLIFTPAFLPISGLFFWQIIGDVFKAASIILGYQFFAKKLTRAFIITEIISLGLFYFLSDLLIKTYGIEGIVMAYAINYFLYFLILVYYFRKIIF